MYKVLFSYTESDSSQPGNKESIWLSLSSRDEMEAERVIRAKFPQYQVVRVVSISE